MAPCPRKGNIQKPPDKSRTTSTKALNVVAGEIPVYLLAKERLHLRDEVNQFNRQKKRKEPEPWMLGKRNGVIRGVSRMDKNADPRTWEMAEMRTSVHRL
ncbi:hypothetical protein JTB14_002322 [Gonioctena quinquepunctata]|nr:hypothetical protein JTB14_002322 [Gonioctena quinquepunctata]